MPFFEHAGIQFHYRETGIGTPFILQHGLGGDTNQTFSLYKPPDGVRLITMDCRGHGETRPLGNPDYFSMSALADDVVALMTHLGLQYAVIGGVSMGAAVALNLALRYPQHVSGLVLSRPAWLDKPNPTNLEVYALIVMLMTTYGPIEGLAHFTRTHEYNDIASNSSDAAASLVGQFTHPRAMETLVRLERIPTDTPVASLDELSAINVHTLVLANKLDPIHPYEYGIALMESIPGAVFCELTPKSINKTRHADDFQRCVDVFLKTLKS
jgi:pimeloyl-ACP methyl ester carboxylesterase